MLKKEIENESRKVAAYFEKFWPIYSSSIFDKTFSLRNWTTIMASILLYFNENKIKNFIPYENKLKTIFNNKKILHIGSGPGYFLTVIKSLGGIPYGIEPYCKFYENLNIHKNTVQDLINLNSKLSLRKDFNKNKFDVIVAHDFFVPSIIFDEINAHKVLFSLKKYLNKEGIMVFEHQNEKTLLKTNKLKKYGYDVKFVEDIINPYGKKCMQVIIILKK